jgi:hypothetical protein
MLKEFALNYAESAALFGVVVFVVDYALFRGWIKRFPAYNQDYSNQQY